MSSVSRNPKAFIFTQPRTGSNNISYILNCHPELKVGNELLHPHNGISLDVELIGSFKKIEDYNSFGFSRHWSCFYDDEVLNRVVEGIFRDFNSFKIHTSHIDDSKKKSLLKDFPEAKIILTTRSNRYEQAMSNFVANHTNVWHTSDLNKARNKEVGPEILDELEFCRWVEQQIQDEANLKEMLSDLGVSYFEFIFEDFFSDDLNNKIETLNNVFQFLSLKKIGEFDNPLRSKLYEKLLVFLDPKKQKVTRTYCETISNAEQLKDISIENGWL